VHLCIYLDQIHGNNLMEIAHAHEALGEAVIRQRQLAAGIDIVFVLITLPGFARNLAAMKGDNFP
jgi:hypothetical protein